MRGQSQILTIEDVLAICISPAEPRVRAVTRGHFLDSSLVKVARRPYDIK
jgi:hypothetical protein